LTVLRHHIGVYAQSKLVTWKPGSLELFQSVAGHAVDTLVIGGHFVQLGLAVLRCIGGMTLQANRIFAIFHLHAFDARITDNLLVESPMNGIVKCRALSMHGAGPLLVDIHMAQPALLG